MPYRRSHPRTAALRSGRSAVSTPRLLPGGRWTGPAPAGPGPVPRWAVPAAATALLTQVVPVVGGLLWIALLAGTGCDEGCDPTVRGPLNMVALGYRLGHTVTPAALALCWLLAVRRSWAKARWIAAGLAYVPPAMIVLGVLLLFVPGP
ncbi:hypothetical protein ABZ401_28985 [Streptomyces sp. NPDC005892]|uniref:hypothetical protein n=1 Tax=Streptomyces sp. NPDC005892 TaxID=3155593 RepID=UPI0034100ABD